MAQVGLDINVAAHSAWQQAPLQFIAGLGPRKAQLLARSVQREEFVATRNALWKELGVMERVVFRHVTSLPHVPFLGMLTACIVVFLVAANRAPTGSSLCSWAYVSASWANNEALRSRKTPGS
jgi:hypothetical protein